MISIHAPAWGATNDDPYRLRLWLGFNPRARMGRDLIVVSSILISHSFNPRARMGRDFRRRSTSASSSSFNPRARMGRDLSGVVFSVLSLPFQSTRPHGARPRPIDRGSAPASVSIHAPAWGATLQVFILYPPIKVSIHAPAWGATYPSRICHTISVRFNPRARMGRDF